MYRRYLKRVMDFVFSLCALLVLAPVLLAVAALVRVKLGSPVVFKQSRPGLGERPFTVYKFRTMTDACDANGEARSDEERLTRFGRFLRSTSLDELPELWSVLRGDMSLVGPRPLLMKYLPYFREEERVRSSVRPGITGLAQISGRNVLTWDKRFKADVEYVRNVSFALDVKIALRTVLAVLHRKDILVGSEHVLRDLHIERGIDAEEVSVSCAKR